MSEQALPVAIAAAPGDVVNLQDILLRAFGPGYKGISSVVVEYRNDAYMSSQGYGYWGTDPHKASSWFVNGQEIGGTNKDFARLSASDFANAELHVGNNMAELAYVTVQNADGVDERFAIYTVLPKLTQGLGSGGHPTPSDVVAAAYRYAHEYK